MLDLQKKHHETRMERDKELYERQIKIIDTQIDRLVYELYGLTDEEVKVGEPRKNSINHFQSQKAYYLYLLCLWQLQCIKRKLYILHGLKLELRDYGNGFG
jgi:hypothetical protein